MGDLDPTLSGLAFSSVAVTALSAVAMVLFQRLFQAALPRAALLT
jgi:hypothetical protein